MNNESASVLYLLFVHVHAEVRACKKGRIRNQGKMQKISMVRVGHQKLLPHQ